MTKYLVIDTETGGLDPKEHSLLTVSIVALDENFEVFDELDLQIKHKTYNITPYALKVNNIDLDSLDKKGIEVDKAIINIYKFINQHSLSKYKPIIIGHNVQFDIDFLSSFVETNTTNDIKEVIDESICKYVPFKQLINYQIIDTCTVMRTLGQLGLLPKNVVKLEDCVEYFNLSHKENQHSSIVDCKNTAELLKVLKERLKYD